MGNNMRIGIRLDNFKEMTAALRNLPAKVEANVIGVAISNAAKPIIRRAKSLASVRTGALRKSITSVLRKYPGKAVVVIGPDRDYYENGKKLKGRKAGADRPANYAHLVEFGHSARNAEANLKSGKFIQYSNKERKAAIMGGSILPSAGRKAVTFIPAKPFLRPAVMDGETEAAASFAEGVATGLVREVKKMNVKIIKQRGTAA